MEGEFNNFDINNTNITFSVATNNIETSDETKADPIYQRQMGTVYSRGKGVATAITITGITLAFTAIAISTGSVLKNIFVPNPPEVVSPVIALEKEVLTYKFEVKNQNKYKTTFYIDLNGETVYSEDVSEAKVYEGKYSPVKVGDYCKVYISFTNSLDYYKTIYVNEFKAK